MIMHRATSFNSLRLFLLTHFAAFLSLAATAALAQTHSSGATNNVYVVPFSHLDLMWAGTREECLSRGCRIIAKAIRLAKEHPEFRFLLEDDVFTANFADAHRGLLELDDLKQLVKEGRIELAPKWAGIYQNLPRAETLVRNIVYGKKYARETFGVDPQVAHFGDIPGFTSQLPQILAKSGLPFMVMTRMGPPDNSLFRYRSPDGSSALVWSTIKGYGWGVGLGLHRDNLGETNFDRIAKSVRDVQATAAGPIYLGWGTDLFAPSENLVPNIALLTQKLAPLHFQFATPTEFFRAASQVAPLKVLSGEIPSSWGNILTSMCHLWPPTVQAADTLVSAEKFAAINYALGYADYPQAEFETLWKCAIEAVDHNNFGQGGDIGDTRKLEYAATATMRAGEILRQSLRNIAERVQRPFPRSTAVIVFNPLSWTRDDLVSAHVSVYGDISPGDIADYRKATKLVDETGASVQFHVGQSYGTVSRASEIVFVAKGVPSLGYKTYFMMPADKIETASNACDIKMEDAGASGPKRVVGADQMENQFYKVSADRITGRITVFDKELGQPIIEGMEIVASEERGGNSIAIEPTTGRTIINNVDRIEVEENNAVRAVMRIEGSLGGEPIVQRLALYEGIKRLDIENTLDWKQGRLMKIEQLFPYNHPDAQIRYGIPFGSAAGNDILPNSGPRGGDEVPRDEWKQWRQVQDWVFAGTPDWGVTITTDRLLITLGEGVVRAGMLRGTFSTTGFTREGKPVLVQVPPAGKYVYHYSLSSGKGGWAAAKSYRIGMASSNPLIPVNAVDELSGKILPPTHSFCSFTADNLVVTALKKAEHDNSALLTGSDPPRNAPREIALRIVEMEGISAETPIQFGDSRLGFRPVNLLEEESQSADEQTLRVKPFEINTVRLKLNN
jgi:alpha-mannosidase